MIIFGVAVNKNIYLIAIMLSFALLLSVHAASLNGYLSTYLPNSLISNSSFYKQSFNSNSYVVMQLPGANNRFLINSNASSNYTFVTDPLIINNVLTPFIDARAYPSAATLNSLNSSIREYMQYSHANLSDCLQETGLNANTCTFQNNCVSCQSIPVCKKVLDAIGGVNSTFGLGIMNISIQYGILNNSYKGFESTLSSINKNNAGTVVSQLYTITQNLSTVQNEFDENPVFPPPFGTSFADCNSGGNPFNQPWYCTAVGYCYSVPFNTTKLSNIQGTLSTLEASLPSQAGLASISANSTALATSYLNAYTEQKNGNSFNSMISALTPQYNLIVNNSQTLLLKYNNASLGSSIQTLIIEFKAIQKLGVNQSIGVANKTLTALIANSTSIYKNANATYYQLYGISQNNTGTILADQLSYEQVPSRLASLANQQQNINLELGSRINSTQIAAILPTAQSIRVESAVFVAPLTISYLIKEFDSSFIYSILSNSNSYAPSRIASAPLYAAIESFIIGMLVILVIYIITYFRIIRKGKMKNNKKMQTRWIIIFVALFIIVLIYTYATYAYASNANNFLPFNYFLNSVRTNSNVYIALNESAASNASIASCTNTLQSYLSKAGKTVQTIKLSNYSCVSGSNISVLGLNCYVDILSADKPVILISQSQNNELVYKGLYGTVLYAQGSVATGSQCTLASIFNNV